MEGLVEPLTRRVRGLEVMMARSLVRVEGGGCSIRLMNPGVSNVVLYKNKTIGLLRPTTGDVEVVVENERPDSVSAIEQQESVLPGEKSNDLGELPAHLQDLYDKSVEEVLPNEARLVQELLIKYQEVFSKNDADLGRTGVVKHVIDTGDAAPVRQRYRRTSPSKQAEIDRQVQQMLDNGVIERSTSPWASPVVLVPKKNGESRFAIDFRRVNQLTRSDAYPLPRIDDSLSTLAGSRWFSSLDINSGYWQLELDDNSKEKSAFVTRSGLYQFNVLPYGLSLIHI